MNLTTILIAIVIFITLFLVLREVNNWYWKINKRIELSERQNLLLEQILFQLSGKTIDTLTENSENNIKDKSTFTSELEFLSDEEKKVAEKFINYGLMKGERIVFNKKSRKIDRLDQKEWNEILKNFEQNDWIIIKE